MTKAQKFSFSQCFDEALLLHETLDQGPANIEEPEVIMPEDTGPIMMYGEDDLHMAKTLAFEEGREQGYKEAETHFEAKHSAVLEKLSEQMLTMMSMQDHKLQEMEQTSANVALAVAKIFLHRIPKEVYQKQLGHMVRDFFAAHQDKETTLRITCHHNDLPCLEGIIASPSTSKPNVTLSADADMACGDVVMSWGEGFSTFSQSALMDHITTFFKTHQPSPKGD